MGVKVGINGFGRIGRMIAVAASEERFKSIEIVAINDLATPGQMAHLLKYDSVHGRFEGDVKSGRKDITLNGKKIVTSHEVDPSKINWKSNSVDIVLECTGVFKKRQEAQSHFANGAKFILISAPSNDADITLCFGVNDDAFKPDKHKIISNASCTTNCVAPVAKIIDDAFKIKNAMMTTVHSYTSDQRLLDNRHSDLRRARAAALSIIPTSTGATKAVEKILPNLKNRLTGIAIRVPTPNVSMVDLTVLLEKNATEKSINNLFKKASKDKYSKILSYSDDELVSVDFNGSPFSAIFDAPLTQVTGGKLAKVFAWYDNEVGFSHRMIDLASLIGKRAKL
ncbi:MAG: type I glyceraldehyde-3-phosphate dehydrogenase [Deltaproteobacteria bacterium RIFCSPHIGHO2_12_FULL_43_9]|nr:MAG: type I glyceraldehyde-3-phosphate dehydrogenase [Deltaproteobacteria bacterium RIFCSPHIGHO2_12_FULL_43_9]